MKKARAKFPKELVKDYGEQVFRDRRARTRYGGKCSFSDAAIASVWVAQACGLITEKEMPRFEKEIINYAKTTRFPKDFL
jgi:hypothetical protein